MIKNKYNKRLWTRKDIRTITLNETYPEGWNEFVQLSGISNIDIHKDLFNLLYNLYGDRMCIENTRDYLTNKLQFYIENEAEKLNKINSVWDKQIDKLFGDYNELNQYRIGNITEDIENYDKYKSARQTELKQKDILKQIKSLEEMKTPIENSVNIIKAKLFLPYQKSIEEEKGDWNGY